MERYLSMSSWWFYQSVERPCGEHFQSLPRHYSPPLELQHPAPLVSVCVPNFNRDEELFGAIESIVASDYRNLEVIVVDDGSANEFQPAVSRVEALLHEKGIGRVIRADRVGGTFARNLGFSQAKGDWVLFFDSDDFLLPDTVTRFVALMQREGADVVAGWVQSFHHNGERTLAEALRSDSSAGWVTSGDIGPLATFVDIFGGAGALHSKKALTQVGGFQVVAPGIAFQDFNLFMKERAANFHIATLVDVAYLYRTESRGSVLSNQADVVFSRKNALRPLLLSESWDRRLLTEYAFARTEHSVSGEGNLDHKMEDE